MSEALCPCAAVTIHLGAHVPSYAMLCSTHRCRRLCRLQALNGTELEGRIVSAKLDKLVQ